MTLCKRSLDIIVASLVLTLFSPLLLVIALLVKWKLGSPVFFRQSRPGFKEMPFQMIKFRTMLDLKNENGETMPDAKRLTRFGAFLRSTSLDELPELWNVLIGNMSLVGPRPLLMEYLPLYSEKQKHRHDVRPGLTGWAQINGRNTLSWDDKFALDIWYVKNQSFLLDIKILLLTVLKVIKREGISSEGQVTMQKFTGSNPKKLIEE